MTAPPDLPPPLAEAADLANQGDVNGALEVLDRVPEAERDAQYHTFRAALLLSVGQVDEARAAIDRALAVDPNSGFAYAQRSIIELVQNQQEEALADAERAVELSPEARRPRSRCPMPSRATSSSRRRAPPCSRRPSRTRTTRSPGRAWPSCG